MTVAATCSAFTLAMDPYGVRASPTRPAAPLMDINQRYMYPQVVRSGRFDSAVFGTSTMRLVDPKRLDAGTGAHFANLAMNAATPWEQMQLANLFLRHTPKPEAIVLGVDFPWCSPNATDESSRLTFRSFPPWLYSEDRTLDFAHMFDFRSLEMAGRVAANRLGLTKDRLRPDGFAVFTPPENLYDLARARTHIWQDSPDVTPVEPPVAPSAEERARWSFPATAWMGAFLDSVPAGTRVVMVFPPLHVAAQPRPGGMEAARQDACKAEFTALAAKHGASVIDMRFANAVTRNDENYWDSLHYRLPLAGRIADVVIRALNGQPETDQEFAHIVHAGERNAPRPGG